jgi:diguanylate cyclase (GGDEF)-like protein
MKQWGEECETYDIEDAPKIGYGQMTGLIRPSEEAVHMTDFILFHGREQYGIWSAEIDISDAFFYENLSLEIGSAIYTLRSSLAEQKLRNDLEIKNKILDYAASHDQLTGVLNRTGVMSSIVEFISEKRKSSECCFLAIMADLDHLKQINDTFGHNEGDSAIRAGADIIKNALPEGSPFGRTGGDEFTAIMECSSEQDGDKLKADIKKACADYNSTSGKDYYVDLSVGYCLMAEYEDMQHLIQIMQKADKMLYEEKKHRRESVVRNEKH